MQDRRFRARFARAIGRGYLNALVQVAFERAHILYGVPFPWVRLGFNGAAVPMQVERAELRFGQLIAREPAVGGAKATRRMHRLIGVGLEGGVGVGGHDLTAREAAERVVFERRGFGPARFP